MSESVAQSSDRYVVVARRYRPRGFEQLVGQEHVARALKNAIETGRVGHAYLFTGARGVGKTSTARIFAKALNAPEGPTATPDDSSDICQAIDAGEDIDVLEIDGASNRGIDEIRQLRSGVGVRPSRARYKIYIIDEVHMLTQAAFNALLKTLEEPPEHVKFIFCTTDPEKIPITVLSRCQRFDFAPVRVDEIAGRLREIVDAERAEADDEALRLLARRAAGSMRDSQSLLEQVLSFSSGRLTVESVHSMLGTADDARMVELAEALGNRDSRKALDVIDAAVLGGVDAGQLAEQLLGFFRDMMTAAVGCDAEMLRFTSSAMHPQLKEQGQQVGLQTILGIVALLDQTLVRIRQSVHGQVLLEAAVVQICTLPDLDAITRLAAALSGAGGNGAAGGEKKNASRPAAAVAAPQAVQAAARAPAPGGTPLAEQPAAPSPAQAPAPAQAPSPAEAPSAAAQSPGAVRSASAASAASAGAAQVSAPVGTGGPSRPQLAAASGGREGGAPVAAGGESQDLVVPLERPWDKPTAERVWQAALAAMDGMTADFARQAAAVEPQGKHRLRLMFPADRELARRACEKPERKTQLEAAIRSVSARDVQIDCDLCSTTAAPPKPAKASAAVNRRQLMREAEGHPLVQELIELFEAEIVRVDQLSG
ncbi:DNA polymerase III subunit gamma/tau [Candidatus Laterigemmans baculatus]|uniref:DNA polymerase III subunit gamma/tau n=1 Tax=Candidatus Laterigemmans baculatus TaxID=2770505 RepID=UPI0013DC2689|nr:DNA polymerase III subunit gamma/tau [Candidatus Laterigemmans baculatus]